MSIPIRRFAAIAVLALVVGCGRPTPRESVRMFTFDGVVERVDRGAGTVAVDHEDIPGLMPAMRMDFTPEDPALLDEVVAGDEVRGELRASYDEAGDLAALDLVDLVVRRPALRLGLSADGASLTEERPTLEPGMPVPDFAMTTQEGDPLRLSDLRGKVVVLTFVYTRCPLPEFCPLMDRKFAELADRTGRSAERAERVRLLSVSFDPEHDTPAVLAEHAARVGAEPPLWTYAVADHDELEKVVGPLGLLYGPTGRDISHTLSTALIAPDGTLARLDRGGGWEPAELDAAIRRLLPGDRSTRSASRSR